jgi:hypothetical protein
MKMKQFLIAIEDELAKNGFEVLALETPEQALEQIGMFFEEAQESREVLRNIRKCLANSRTS